MDVSTNAESVLRPAVYSGLQDRSYDKRKMAALEVTALMKSWSSDGDHDKITSLLWLLAVDFATSKNEDHRKGAVIALAASAIGLGAEKAAVYLDKLLTPLFACFNDVDSPVCYYACESLYNIAKVVRTGIVTYFARIFDEVCKMLAHDDVDVRSGASLLDRMMRDIAREVKAATLDVYELSGNGVLCWCELSWPETVTLSGLFKLNTTMHILNLGGADLDSTDAVMFAEALKVNTSVRQINFGCTKIGDQGARELASALAVNQVIQHVTCEVGDIGASALAEALRVNSSVRYLNLEGNAIGVLGIGSLADALAVNSTIEHLNLQGNDVGGDDSATEQLAAALKVNTGVRQIILKGCKIGKTGAKALASALAVNSTLQRVNLANNKSGEKGLLALAGALKVNTSIQHIDVRGKYLYKAEFFSLVEAIMRKNATFEASLFPDFRDLFGSELGRLVQHGVIGSFEYGVLKPTGKYPAGLNVEAVLREWGTQFVDLTNISRANSDGSYCAVAAVMLGDVDNALQFLRLWPVRSGGQVLLERYGSRFSVIKRGFLYDIVHYARKEARQNQLYLFEKLEAIEAAVAVSWAITSTFALSMVNVHLCGEGYAGKTMTRQALLRTLGCGTIGRLILPSRLSDIALEKGRTLGMVSEAVEFRSNNGAPVRVLLHDYGGQLEFRANHAPHLSAANSVYVVVVPLWDKRPGHDRAYELEDIVAMYTQWLKFLYTVVPTAVVATETPSDEADSPVEPPLPVLSQCLTVVNFARCCSAEVVHLVEQRLVEVLDMFNAAPDNRRVHFIEKPIMLDANSPTEVHKLLAPVLKQVIEELSTAPIPIAPCLQTVLADKALNNEWSLFTTESQLKGLIKSAIKDKNVYGRVPPNIPDEATREKVLDTICEITQGMLESRRDIVVFPVHTGERISINRPNWLTNELLGSLFDPKVRPQLMKAAAMRRVEEGAEDSHLLGLQDINAAVKSKLDSMTRAMIDDSFIPKLLQHVGVCIPVMVDEGGLVRAVAEGTDASAVQHWFPAFSTIAMKVTDGVVLSGADHVVARQFKLVDPDFCIFPPGYFSSLFVSIVSLYNTTSLIKIFKNGMVLRSATDRFQIVVRQTADEKSIMVTVATVGSEPGSDLAFQTIQEIKKFIYSESDWRGNVRVQECGLHPTLLLDGPSIHIQKVVERLRDPKQREEHLAFFFGLEHGQPLILQKILDELLSVSKVVKQIAQALETFHKEFSVARTALVAQLQDQQEESLEAVHDLAEVLELSISRAEGASAANNQDFAKVLDSLTSLSSSPHSGDSDGPVSADALQALVSDALAVPLQQVRTALAGAGDCSREHLQAMKAEIISEVSLMAAEMHRVVEDKLSAADEVRTAAAQETLRDLMKTELLGFVASRDEESRAITAAQVAVLLDRLGDAAGRQEELWDGIVALRNSVQVVRSVQTDTVYGVYDTPLLLSITQPPATGLTGSLKRTLYEVYRLHFVCPCCGKKAPSGPKGHGYELRVTQAWVTRMSKVLRCTLLALQVLSLVTPVPLPHLADLAQYLPSDTEEWTTVLATAHKTITQSEALGSALADEMGALSLTSTIKTATAPLPVSTAAPPAPGAVPERPIITLEHVTSVLEVLQMAREALPPAHPKQTGLSRAICTSKGQCAWVCQQGEDGKDSACKTRYMAAGNDCLAIQMVLA